jgi:hypothetical protein
MEKAKISGKSPAVAAVVYDRLKGVDFSTDQSLIDTARSPFALNLVSGPGGYPEKRPGWRTLQQLEGHIYGLHMGMVNGENVYLVHCGDKILRWWPGDPARGTVQLRNGINQNYSRSFVHQDRIFILTGREYLAYGVFDDVEAVKPVSDIATIPTVFFNSSPLGEDGVPLQDRNLLTNYRTVGFVGAGDKVANTDEPKIYKLPFDQLGDGVVKIKVQNKDTMEWDEYTEAESQTNFQIKQYDTQPYEIVSDGEGGNKRVELNYPKYGGYWWSVHVGGGYGSTEAGKKSFLVNRTYGFIGFCVAPWDNRSAGADNVEISVEVLPKEDEEKDGIDTLNKCDTFAVFEERIWMTGNPEKPAFDWHSDADDPTYFPDTGYTRVGTAGTEILGYLQVGTAQAIIKAEGNQDASVYLRTVGTLNDLTAFPIKQGVSGQGAIAKRAFSNILDDPLYLTRNGVFAVSSNIVTEQRTLANRSRFLDPKLTREANLKEAVACSWNGMYLLSMTDGTVYIMDGKQEKSYQENSLTGAGYNYEAYHWNNMPATCWLPDGAVLYFGTSDGRICKLNTDIGGVEKYNDDGAPIRAVRATRVEFCGDFLRYKTMVKKGSGLLMQPYSRSSLKVYVRTDRTKAQDFFKAALDDDDWAEVIHPEDFGAWEEARVVPFKKKVKKWKWIQIIVENNEINEGFGVYGMIIRHQKQNLV